jgi:MEMO1 family protein
MKNLKTILFWISIFILLSAQYVFPQNSKIRNWKDTVGFTTKSFQMDSLMRRIDRKYRNEYAAIRIEKHISNQVKCRVAICPHDDYTYAGSMYPLALENIKARVVIIFGVAHKIRIKSFLKIFRSGDPLMVM